MPGAGIEPARPEGHGILRCRRPIQVPNEWVRIDAFRRESDDPGCRLQHFPTAFGASFLPVSCQYATRASLRKDWRVARCQRIIVAHWRLIRIVRPLLAISVNDRNQIGFDSGLGHQTFIPCLNRPQVAESRCGYCGSNKAVSIERNSFRKEQLLEPLALIERRLHPQVGGAR
jgi:hypothetical protein